MASHEMLGTARVIAEAVWTTSVIVFLVFTFYVHFRIRPFNRNILFDAKHEDHGFQVKVLMAFLVILVSGLLLFAKPS